METTSHKEIVICKYTDGKNKHICFESDNKRIVASHEWIRLFLSNDEEKDRSSMDAVGLHTDIYKTKGIYDLQSNI